MMGLLHSWRDSLLLLTPHNFKLFALATFKSIIETYKVLARVWYLWLLPVIVPMVLVASGLYYVSLGSTFFESLLFHMFGLFLLTICVWMSVLCCLATRPSNEQKNLNYFKDHVRFFLLLAFAVILLWQFDFWLHWLKIFSRSYTHESASLFRALEFLLLADFMPLWIFFILFFLDSDGGIKQLLFAAVRAVQMTVYNLPLLIVLVFALVVPSFILAHATVAYQWPEYIGLLLYLFLLKPLLINIWTNIYIKKLHETPKLYK